jgi:hypothetical protein
MVLESEDREGEGGSVTYRKAGESELELMRRWKKTEGMNLKAGILKGVCCITPS